MLLRHSLVRATQVQAITGEQEGVYAWLAVNYALGRLGSSTHESVGVLDMGGGSAQIAVEVKDSVDVQHVE